MTPFVVGQELHQIADLRRYAEAIRQCGERQTLMTPDMLCEDVRRHGDKKVGRTRRAGLFRVSSRFLSFFVETFATGI